MFINSDTYEMFKYGLRYDKIKLFNKKETSENKIKPNQFVEKVTAKYKAC